VQSNFAMKSDIFSRCRTNVMRAFRVLRLIYPLETTLGICGIHWTVLSWVSQRNWGMWVVIEHLTCHRLMRWRPLISGLAMPARLVLPV